MTDSEFDLLDELYFVQSFDNLKNALNWEDEKLLHTLLSLYQKGLIKCLAEPDQERFDQVDVLVEGKELLYLATKKGLMAHNTL